MYLQPNNEEIVELSNYRIMFSSGLTNIVIVIIISKNVCNAIYVQYRECVHLLFHYRELKVTYR